MILEMVFTCKLQRSLLTLLQNSFQDISGLKNLSKKSVRKSKKVFFFFFQLIGLFCSPWKVLGAHVLYVFIDRFCLFFS